MHYKTDAIQKTFSIGEVIANSVTHAIGIGLSIAALVILIVQATKHGSGWHLAGYLVFGISLIILYLTSTVYHSTPDMPSNAILQRLDHVAIFFLIAGTYTPFLLTKLRGTFGWIIFGIIWGLTLIALTAKLVFTQRFVKPPVWLYIVMSWFGVIIFFPIMRDIGNLSLILLLVGGAFYTSGIIFYRLRKLPFAHAIWHLFVIGGSVFHFFSVLELV